MENNRPKYSQKPFSIKILKLGSKSTQLKPTSFNSPPKPKVLEDSFSSLNQIKLYQIDEECSPTAQTQVSGQNLNLYFYFQLVEIFLTLTELDPDQAILSATLFHMNQNSTTFQKALYGIHKIQNLIKGGTQLFEAHSNFVSNQSTGGQVSLGIEKVLEALQPSFQQYKQQLQVLSGIFYDGLSFDDNPEQRKAKVYKNICFACKEISLKNQGSYKIDQFLSRILLFNYQELEQIQNLAQWVEFITTKMSA